MTFQPRVDRYSRITVKMCSYSVPVRFIDRKVTVHLTGDTLVVFEGRREIARHARLAGPRPGAPGPGPLSGGAAAQTWRSGPFRGVASSPRRGHLHRRARGVLGHGQAAARRDRRNESPGQDPSPPSPPATRGRARGLAGRRRVEHLQ
ncbi:hypothetical protein [Streptomyces sp. NPDC058678]|uniref:Mu transposase domain-containing protein n=1 Tax=Streptomyces sp. NPDC058678 TaxID=3346595 RepID=UPI003658F8A1